MSFLAHNIDIEYNGKKYHLDSADVLFGNKKELRGLSDTWVKKIGSIGSVDYDYPFKSIELFVVTRDSSSVYEDTMLAVIKPNPRGRGGNKYNLAVINGKEFLSQLLKNLQVSDSRKIKDGLGEPIKCENSNLYFYGTKLDKYGNECAVFSTPNHNTFSIQRNSLWGTQSWNTGSKSTMDAETFLAKNPKVSLESLERDVIKLANQTNAAWGKNIRVHNKQILDSQKIKDENTMDVLDGVLFIGFEDGTEEDMIAEVNKHANESGEIDGVKYETYETDSSDGVAMIDLCAMTDDANGFVKALLEKWGITDNVIDLEFEPSDEMKEAVNDSQKVGDMVKPVHLRGYAEKVRANRRKKNEETENENEPENEKQDVADSQRVRDDKPKYDEYFVKKVECYINDGEDIVYVAALSKNGGDGAAIRRVQEKFPDLDIIEVYDTDGCIDVYNMTDAQYEFCEEGAIMIPEDMKFRSVDDLEWI